MWSKKENIERIQQLIGNESLNSIVEHMVEKIYEQECFIMINPNRIGSGHKPTPFDCYIILGTDPTRDKLHILWDLFHEYGHHLDEKNLSKLTHEQKQIREKFAWRMADKEFLKAGGVLDPYIENYIAYRTSCLATYEISDYSGSL